MDHPWKAGLVFFLADCSSLPLITFTPFPVPILVCLALVFISPIILFPGTFLPPLFFSSPLLSLPSSFPFPPPFFFPFPPPFFFPFPPSFFFPFPPPFFFPFFISSYFYPLLPPPFIPTFVLFFLS